MCALHTRMPMHMHVCNLAFVACRIIKGKSTDTDTVTVTVTVPPIALITAGTTTVVLPCHVNNAKVARGGVTIMQRHLLAHICVNAIC